MELNHDLIRDILLTIEELDYTVNGTNKDDFENHERLSEYASKQILYTLKRLSDAGYINVTFGKGEAFFAFYNVNSMTFEGHQLLDDIRDEKVWRETKEKASKLSSVSIPVLQQLASSVTKQIFGLQ
ncbi:DUF2513 domain-containing protein [Staphylococcus cohnii]|uniref:DUF2513 domain-containing protein n=1 Tax=Staphylococcus cohnii TaxID=29382 RepID=UPI0015E5ED83|nr:DUF2513 domain-containing protein [Staphylococcus cohnii]MBA1352665.1 DUF2513 domain-containing protein [Staphylococcus cohnii]MBA1391044.1 DUF2513 domain-containing protein [Staphylococcus cohnii]